MRTYFLSWESENKRGHSMYEFSGDETPREILKIMISEASKAFPDICGDVTAIQFNRVD